MLIGNFLYALARPANAAVALLSPEMACYACSQHMGTSQNLDCVYLKADTGSV